MSAPLGAPVQLYNHFDTCNVCHIVCRNETASESKSIANAVHIQMKSATELAYPDKWVILRQVQTKLQIP